MNKLSKLSKVLLVLTAAFLFSAVTGHAQSPAGTQHAVTVTWTVPSPVGGSGAVQGYNLYRLLIPTTTYSKINASLLTATSYVDNAVTPGAAYDYEVTTTDTANSESAGSAASPQANIPTNPNPPPAPSVAVH